MGSDDPDEICFQGQVIGRMQNGVDGRVTVTINITYSADPDQAVVPLSWFANGLTRALNHVGTGPVLECSDADVEEADGPTLLVEKVVKANGYKWQFHLNDADPWPSAVHGHDYEKGLVLDLLTGQMFNAFTRQPAGKLKAPALLELKAQLRQARGFQNRI